MPGGACTSNAVADPARLTVARFASPEPLPASSRKLLTGTAGGIQENRTGLPEGPCVTANPSGAAGGPLQPMVTETSFDGALVTPCATARTRMKYVPLATGAVIVVGAAGTGTLAMLASPDAVPASIT